jgi:hypothetical protein
MGSEDNNEKAQDTRRQENKKARFHLEPYALFLVFLYLEPCALSLIYGSERCNG